MKTLTRKLILRKAFAGSQSGVSLVEFMVASTIGLILIAGAASLMLSVQQGRLFKQDLDHAQENFRYGANIIQRVIRQGSSFADPGSDGGVKVIFSANGSDTHDCLGNQTVNPNTLFVSDNGELVCKVAGGNSYALADGFEAPLTVEYGFDKNGDGIVEVYQPIGSASWNVPSSVRITLRSLGQSISFVATMRSKAVSDGSGTVLKPAG